MPSRLEHKFEIRRICKPTDQEYLEALKIYNETTPYDIKTSTNEITYWLSNKSETSRFEVILFALYLNDRIIGLSMTTYIKTTKIVIDEYLAVENQYRLNLVFLSYQSLLQNYYNENAIEVSFFLTEISNKNNGTSIDKESLISMKMLCMQDYGKVNSLYYTLPLGLNNHESSFEAFIYLKSNDSVNKLSNESYLCIIESIYYDYYVEWYMAFLSDKQHNEYRQKVDHFYKLIKDSLVNSKKTTIDITQSVCETTDKLSAENARGIIPAVKKRKWFSYPIIFLIIIFLPILLIWVYSEALNLLNIQMSSVSNAIGSVVSTIITATASLYISGKKS